MTAWPEVELGEVCEFKYGKSLAADKRDGGVFPVFGSNGAVGLHSQALTKGPTIIVGRKGSLGEVTYSESPCWPIDTTYYIDATATNADLRWLAYRLDGLGLTTLNRAAAVPGLNREDAYRQRLLLPPLDEQRRIAAILDQADAIRAKRRRVFAYLDSLTQSIYDSMFGDAVANVELAAACTRITDGTHQSPKWGDSGIPFLFVSNITSGEIDMNTQKFISEETWRELTRRTPIEAGDVLYSTVGSYGIPAVVRTGQKFAFQRHIAHLKPDPRLLLPDFLAAQLASPRLKRQAARAARGIAQPTVNLADIKKFSVVIPSLTAQERFGACMSQVSGQRIRFRAAESAEVELFFSLQSRAFQGEL